MYVEIKKNILEWVRKQIEGTDIKKESIELLNDWIADIKKPTLGKIRDLGKVANIPFGYFFLQTPPDEKINLVEYRTVKSISNATPSRNLKATIYAMERLQEWMKEEVIQEYGDGPEYVAKLKGYKKADVIADYIRKAIGISVNWYEKTESKEDAFNEIREKISSSGTVVMQNGVVGTNTHRNLDLKEFRAFAMVDRYAPLIFINAKDSATGRIFSLFHEFAHICLGSDSLYNLRADGNGISGIEVICNAVAGELCVPKQVFVRRWEKGEDSDDLKKITKLAKFFRCSEIVIARRALDCGYVAQNVYDKVAQSTQTKVLKSGGGNYYTTAQSRIDSRLKMLLGNSVLNGRTSYAQAYRLSNTTAATFRYVVLGEERVK